MSTRNNCAPKPFPSNYRSRPSMSNYGPCKLPAIHNGAMPNIHSSAYKSSIAGPCFSPAKQEYGSQYNKVSNSTSAADPSASPDCAAIGVAAYNARTPSYNPCQVNGPTSGATGASKTFSPSSAMGGVCNGLQQTPANRGWSSNQFVGFGKSHATSSANGRNPLINPNTDCPPRPMTSTPSGACGPSANTNGSCGQKTVVRDPQLATSILQKAGMPSNWITHGCLEVITDTPVTTNDQVNCDPNPLCMKKPADCQECYQQSIVVRHLQPPRPPVPPPIIIREHCATQLPAQSPIIIRQIPPRPATPPPLIIRECPPPMPNTQEPTIIDREVPAPPPPPRQVIVERLPTPPPKPRAIIFEKWLPYEEPEDRPCIIEKADVHDGPPPRNIIIQYEALEPRIQSQCINEGISYVDPKEFVNDRPNGNAEVCYVDQLHNLPDHIKSQLGSQALAAIGMSNENPQGTTGNPCAVRTNPTLFYQQQHGRSPASTMQPMFSQRPTGSLCRPQQQQPVPRLLSASAIGLPQHCNKYSSHVLARPSNQGLTNLIRAHYNPWATTYQVSYTNKARSIGRAR